MVTTHPTRIEAIVEELAAAGVEFIVAGGVAAVLQGAPINTFDLDIVHARSPENVARLLAALARLDARSREVRDRLVRPKESHLASPGHVLLMTRHGPLDLLGTIGKSWSYGDLTGSCDEMTIGARRIKVLRLEKLIEAKEAAGREKDLAVLPVLRRTLEEKRKP